MKKNKKAPSLTAKERRELRQKQAETATAEDRSQAKQKRKIFWLSFCACVVALALIITAIVLPLTDHSNEGRNPVATMKLSNGMTIRYEIWMDRCPIASANFIFLANIGYFDGTVLFDNTGGWVRFGGWETGTLHRGDSNTDFLARIQDREEYKANKFGYRLKKDSDADASKTDLQGALCYMYQKSATEYQVLAAKQGEPTVNGSEMRVSAFGSVLDQKDLDNIIAIEALGRDENFGHDYWLAPLDQGQRIEVQSVKVKLYDPEQKKLFKNFSFVDYMMVDNSYVSTWSKTTKKIAGNS